jgi:hypothetical protein
MDIRNRILLTAACACFASAAFAQVPDERQTPKRWSYQVDVRGNRVAKANRITKPDGSWREELREGNCITVKERSATGEYRETRQCNAGNAG